MPDTIPQPRPAPPVDAFFARVKQEVHERLARRQRDKIPPQPMFTILQAAALTGNDVYAIRDMIVDNEIRAVNPTGMEVLIPRDQVLKIMEDNVDECPDD
jgi:excisionase family DNA binding protein